MELLFNPFIWNHLVKLIWNLHLQLVWDLLPGPSTFCWNLLTLHQTFNCILVINGTIISTYSSKNAGTFNLYWNPCTGIFGLLLKPFTGTFNLRCTGKFNLYSNLIYKANNPKPSIEYCQRPQTFSSWGRVDLHKMSINPRWG